MKIETKAELKIVLSLMSEGQKLIVDGKKLISEDQNLIVEGQKLISEGQGKIWKARRRLENLINFDCAEPSWEQLTEAHGAGPRLVPIPPSNISPQKKDEEL